MANLPHTTQAMLAQRFAEADALALSDSRLETLAASLNEVGDSLYDKLVSVLATLGEVAPVGTVNMFFRSTAPAGWLACSGQEVSRTTYKNLFAEIGTTCGAGDGTTTFNVPDFRDLFLRAWDQSGPRTLGDVQEDAVKSHSHVLPIIKSGDEAAGYGAQAGSAAFGDALAIVHPTSPKRQYSEDTGSTETRPKNVALLCCIKY